jgi:hypothetical protein
MALRVELPGGFHRAEATWGMMIVHHGQAITMADLAAGRAADPGVRALRAADQRDASTRDRLAPGLAEATRAARVRSRSRPPHYARHAVAGRPGVARVGHGAEEQGSEIRRMEQLELG